MHQDVLSDAFCGEGIPRWALRVGPDKNFGEKHGFPWPLDRPLPEADLETRTHGPTLPIPTRFGCTKNQTKSTWPEREVSAAAASAYGQLYDSVNPHDPRARAATGPLEGRWALFWRRVAATFRARSSVLGYELINEPFAGNVYENPLLMVPGVADLHKLQPAYDGLSAAIREEDEDALIFFAGVTWDDFDARKWYGEGFSAAPGGERFANRSVLAYHFYAPPQKRGQEASYFAEKQREARRLGVGGMLTEFGSPGWFGRFTEAAAAAESLLQSWSMWEWKTFTKDAPGEDGNVQNAAWGADKTGVGGVVFAGGAVRPKVRRQLSRAYATAVAGETLTNSFDAESAVFRLSFRARLSCALPTEIFLPSAERYPSGFDLAVEPAGAASWRFAGDEAGDWIELVVDPARVKEGATVSLTVAPKKEGGGSAV
jgi:endoglycosylceramidase